MHRAARLPFAVASDGTLLVNVAGHKNGIQKRHLFVGMALTPAEARRVLRRLDDAAHESVALVLAARNGGRRQRGTKATRRRPKP